MTRSRRSAPATLGPPELVEQPLSFNPVIVVVDVVELTAQGGEVTVTVYGFDAIEDVRVSTTHNYFDGTEKQAREHGMELQIKLAGQQFNFAPTKWGRVRCSTATLFSRRTRPSVTIGSPAEAVDTTTSRMHRDRRPMPIRRGHHAQRTGCRTSPSCRSSK
jgi:hypothetical protein